MSDKILINTLPTRTWNRLGVNETALVWDEENTRDLGEIVVSDSAAPFRADISGEGAFSRQTIRICAPENAQITVFETLNPAQKLHVRTQISAAKNAVVKLVQLHTGKRDALLRSEIEGTCAENARIELIQLLPGQGDVYSDAHIDLNGDGASCNTEIGYLGCGEQTVDVNMVVNHFGRKTNCEINASGALKDSARKIFRGTIDFKKGASDSVGNEKETVLMLGDNVVNKTVPLILCAEENVEGNHGATIGEMDDETAFYFESRGIDRQTAESLLSRAAIERLARLTGDETIEKAALAALDEEM